MNCHGNHNQDSNNPEINNQQEEHQHHHGKKHMILMLLCCLIPIVLLMVLPSLNIQNAALRNVLSAAVFLLCPLLHLVMMGGMMKHSKK